MTPAISHPAPASTRSPEEVLRFLTDAVQQRPNDPASLNALGVHLAMHGQLQQGIEFIQRAIALAPSTPMYPLNLAGLLLNQKQPEPAMAVCMQALSYCPNHPELLLRLAQATEDSGKSDEAESLYRRVLQLKPDEPEAIKGIGDVCSRLKRYPEAILAYDQAIALRPGDVESHHNICIALIMAGAFEKAVAVARAGLTLAPDHPGLHGNLGYALAKRGQYEAAITSYRRAIELKSGDAEAHHNLAWSLAKLGRVEDAIAEWNACLSIDPKYMEARSSLGLAICTLGDIPRGISIYRQALEIEPDHTGVQANLALALLTTGDFENGWELYEKRLAVTPSTRKGPPLTKPPWDGSDPTGQTILVHCEQGLGDAIQFSRYVATLAERGAKVILEVTADAHQLLAQTRGAAAVISQGESLPPFDVHVPLLSLPRLLKTRLHTIPARVPYLQPDPDLNRIWSDRFASIEGLKVGIAWQGNPLHFHDRQRSIPLGHFAPIARVPGLQLISIQKGHGAEQLRDFTRRFPVIDLAPELDRLIDTAAVISNLDLLITVDTSVAHLAGALGKPVWLLLPINPDWRWLLNRADSPWYPTFRLFRQTKFAEWNDVFRTLAEELNIRTAPSPPAPKLKITLSPAEWIDRLAKMRQECEQQNNWLARHRLAAFRILCENATIDPTRIA